MASLTPVEVLGSLGGITAFGTSIFIVLRAVARQMSATQGNTEAMKENTQAIRELRTKVGDLDRTVAVHSERIKAQGDELAGLRQIVIRNGHR